MANTKNEYLAAVDLFLSIDKILLGADSAPVWQPGREVDSLAVKYPLEIQGELLGQYLFVNAYPQHPTERFSIGISYGSCIARLDSHHEVTHGNNLGATQAGLPVLIHGAHFHPWTINKQFVISPSTPYKLKLAKSFAALSFDSSLRWFCGEHKIQLPPRHEIELPRRSKLL